MQSRHKIDLATLSLSPALFGPPSSIPEQISLQLNSEINSVNNVENSPSDLDFPLVNVNDFSLVPTTPVEPIGVNGSHAIRDEERNKEDVEPRVVNEMEGGDSEMVASWLKGPPTFEWAKVLEPLEVPSEGFDSFILDVTEEFDPYYLGGDLSTSDYQVGL
jgi:hypothetical protein